MIVDTKIVGLLSMETISQHLRSALSSRSGEKSVLEDKQLAK